MKKLKRVMVIDDDLFTNIYLEIILNQNNITKNIVTFQDGKKALEFLAANTNKVDLILLDINMPKMNGWRFLKEFQKLDKKITATILIVMLTSSVNIRDKMKAEKLQIVKKFIKKPLNEKIVTEIINLNN